MFIGTTSIKGHTNSSIVLKQHGLRIREKCNKSLCIILVILIAIFTTVVHVGPDLIFGNRTELTEAGHHIAGFFKQTVPQHCPYEPYYDIIPDQSIHFTTLGVNLDNAFKQMNIDIRHWFNNCSVISTETLLEIKKKKSCYFIINKSMSMSVDIR
eukprot:914258_1